MWIEWKWVNEWIPNYYNDIDLSSVNLVWLIQLSRPLDINHGKYHCIYVFDDKLHISE